MPTKFFVEKEIAIDKGYSKDKEISKHEKNEAVEKAGKDASDGKHHLHDKVSHKDTEVLQQPHEAVGGASPQGIQKQVGFEKLTDGTKFIKPEIKEFKHEKFEIKEFKHEIKEFKHEKIEIKEKNEKLEFETIPGGVPIGDPGEGVSVNQRLANLEAVMTQLLHFIPAELRPDLTKGALKQEPDAAKAAEPKTGDQTKAKS
jgi:hypothetical protein